MKYMPRKNISIFILGIIVGVIVATTQQYSIPSMEWGNALSFSALSALSIAIVVFIVRALPAPKTIKYLFSFNYTKYASIFIVGAGLVLFIVLLKNGENMATSAFFLLFGLGVLVGSYVAKTIAAKML